MKKKISGLTLLELIVAVGLLGVLVIGFTGIQIFSHTHVVYTDRRAKVQNEVSLVLEHLTRNIKGTDQHGGAIGDKARPPVSFATISGGNAVLIWIDYDKDGLLDSTKDKQIAYLWYNNRIYFNPNYTDNPIFNPLASSPYEPLTPQTANGYGRILDTFTEDTSQATYVSYDPINSPNSIYVQITGRWDTANPLQSIIENPKIVMYTRINMPSVSTK